MKSTLKVPNELRNIAERKTAGTHGAMDGKGSWLLYHAREPVSLLM